ncbi:MAG: HAD-IIIA family hydrolase, partial [Nocardioidaceae bacterium]
MMLTSGLPRAKDGAAFDLALLDRDGTLNLRVPGSYVCRAEDLVLLDGVPAAVARLNACGATVVVVTNQRGIALGRLSWEDLGSVHAALGAALETAGAHVDGFAVCPHDLGECRCRKPADGLFREVLAAAPWAVPERCVMIGDAESDVVPALGLGMRG